MLKRKQATEDDTKSDDSDAGDDESHDNCNDDVYCEGGDDGNDDKRIMIRTNVFNYDLDRDAEKNS